MCIRVAWPLSWTILSPSERNATAKQGCELRPPIAYNLSPGACILTRVFSNRPAHTAHLHETRAGILAQHRVSCRWSTPQIKRTRSICVPRSAPRVRIRFMCRRSPSCRPPAEMSEPHSVELVFRESIKVSTALPTTRPTRSKTGGSSSLEVCLNCGRARSAGPRRRAVVSDVCC